MPHEEEERRCDMVIRVALSGSDFRKLVSGKEVVIEHPVTVVDVPRHVWADMRIILSDIGFDVMRQMIDDAQHEGEEEDLLGTG